MLLSALSCGNKAFHCLIHKSVCNEWGQYRGCALEGVPLLQGVDPGMTPTCPLLPGVSLSNTPSYQFSHTPWHPALAGWAGHWGQAARGKNPGSWGEGSVDGCHRYVTGRVIFHRGCGQSRPTTKLPPPCWVFLYKGSIITLGADPMMNLDQGCLS